MIDSKDEIKVFHHDAFFKNCIELPDIYKPLLDEALPSTIKSAIKFDSIRPEPNNFISKRMRHKSCDILFSASTIDDKKALIFVLCEHQSSPSYWMAHRMLAYTLDIWNKYWKQCIYPSKTLALVYPIVIYNGSSKYKVAKDIQSLFGAQKEEAAKFFQYKYVLIDLQNTDDDAIKEQTYLNFFKYIMKHVHDRDAMLSLADQMIQNYINVIETIDKGNDYAIIENGLMYLTYSISDEEKRMEIIEKIKDNIRNNQLNKISNTMKYGAHFIREEGIKEGRQEGRQEGIKEVRQEVVRNMLEQGFTIKQIASVTKLTKQEIEEIKKSKK